MRKILEFFVDRQLFTAILTVAIFTLGALTAFQMRRDVFPEVEYDITTVLTVYPGASPSEVEKLVTIPIEKEVKNVDGLKDMKSVSTENRSLVILRIDPDSRDPDKVNQDIKTAVDRVLDLPEDAEDPLVTVIESSSVPIIEVSLHGPVEELTLRDSAKRLGDELELISGVSKVTKRGYRDEEVHVEVDPKKLNFLHLSLQEVIEALKGQNSSVPGGTLEVEGKEYLIRTTGEFQNLEEINEAILRSNDEGQRVLVSDVGKARWDFEERSERIKTEGKPAIHLVVQKRKNGDAITIADAVKEKIHELEEEFSSRGIQLQITNDFSYYITRRLGVLQGNLAIGMVLVLIALLLFLTVRVSLVVTMGIPFAFLAAFVFLDLFGVTINLVSMFGMVIVVGMLVDDAIIVCENIYRHMEEGLPVKLAAVQGTLEVLPAVTASVLTTCAAFAPMLFMSGIIGKFMWEVPVVIIFALICSLAEVLTVLPSHMADYVKVPKSVDGTPIRIRDRAWFLFILENYTRFLKLALRFRYVVLGGILAFVFLSVWIAATKMDFILFPPGGIEIFHIRAEVEPGTPLGDLYERLSPIESVVSKLPKEELKTFVTMVGIQQNDPQDPFTKRGSHYGQIVVFLHPEEGRKRSTEEIMSALRKEVEGLPGFQKVSFEEVRNGPPVGKAVSYDIRGAEYSEILKVAKKIESAISEVKGTMDIENNYEEGKGDLKIVVDPKKAAELGVSAEVIGQTIRVAFAGVVATDMIKGDEEVDIRVVFPEIKQKDLESLNNLSIANRMGNLIPLTRLVYFEKNPGVLALGHVDAKRTVSVGANVDTKVVTSTAAHKSLAPTIESLRKESPKVSTLASGEATDTQESMDSLKRAFIAAAFFIFLILVLTFQTLLQPMMILASIPLGLSSVIWTFLVHGKPLSFMALLGVIGLGGVIVNDAIVLIDFINRRRLDGVGKQESIIEAAETRLRPILLTSVTTVFGLLPTAYGIGGNDPFLKPMALALGWGLAMGSLLVIFVIPCLQAVIDDVTTKWSK